MTSDDFELIRGTDNPFADAGLSDPDTKLMKADLAAAILKELRKQDLNNVQAAKLANIQPADVSRIRNADLRRFTIDRLVSVLNALGRRVAVKVAKKEMELA